MPFNRSDIDKFNELKSQLKDNGEITPSVGVLLESLFTIIYYQFEQIEGLKEENDLLKRRIQELENAKKKNSRNSSLPPSKDDWRKRGSNKNSSKRKQGGQIGHKGSTLKKSSKPDIIKNHKLQGRCPCGRALSKAKKKSFEERQVFDIEIKKTITAHRAETGECKCGVTHKADFPMGVTNHTQYGNFAKVLSAYFCQYQLIPFERTQEIFNDLFDLSLCKGSVANHLKKAAQNLIGFQDWAREDLKNSKLNHADETGLQVNKDRYHLHVVSNDKTTFLDVFKGRGIDAVEEMGVLKNYKGRLVHDCYSMYFGFPCIDIICNAHITRELEYFSDREGFVWAKEMKDFLEELYKETEELKGSGRRKRSSKEFRPWENKFKSILRDGKKECRELFNKKGTKQEPVINLYLRIKKQQKGILMFSKDFKIPFTNNQAERDLRMAKVQQKISGCFRSLDMARCWALMRSYTSTMKKRKIGVLNGLKALFDPSLKDPIYSILGPPG